MQQNKEAVDFDTSGLSSLHLNALMFKHILMKGVEVGSIFGLVFIAPYVYYRAPKPINPVVLGRALTTSTIVGPAITGVLGVARISTVTRDGLEDRVYRLNYNQEQSRWDTFAVLGMIGGAGLAALGLGYNPWVLAGGAAVGCSVGTVAHLTTYKNPKQIGQQMIEELKAPAS